MGELVEPTDRLINYSGIGFYLCKSEKTILKPPSFRRFRVDGIVGKAQAQIVLNRNPAAVLAPDTW